MISSRKVMMLAAAVAAFATGLFCNDGSVVRNGVFSKAEARDGRPLTPMSYAGVARRTTRRAVAVGAAAGTAGTAGAYYGSSCVQIVDAYGQVTTHCWRRRANPGEVRPFAAVHFALGWCLMRPFGLPG